MNREQRVNGFTKAETQFHLENLEYAAKWWPKIPPETVDLSLCTRGTLACFGGHAMRNGFFRSRGLQSKLLKDEINGSYREVPVYWSGPFKWLGVASAIPLFGSFHMFESAKSFEVGTPHEIVTSRIQKQLEVIKQYLAEFETEFKALNQPELVEETA